MFDKIILKEKNLEAPLKLRNQIKLQIENIPFTLFNTAQSPTN